MAIKKNTLYIFLKTKFFLSVRIYYDIYPLNVLGYYQKCIDHGFVEYHRLSWFCYTMSYCGFRVTVPNLMYSCIYLICIGFIVAHNSI